MASWLNAPFDSFLFNVQKFSVFPRISPIVPIRRRDRFESAEWLYELKHAGFRTLSYVGDGRSRFVSRRRGALTAALRRILLIERIFVPFKVVTYFPPFYFLAALSLERSPPAENHPVSGLPFHAQAYPCVDQSLLLARISQ